MKNLLRRIWGWFVAERGYLLAFGPSWILLNAFYLWTIYSSGANVTDGSSGHYGELARAFKLHQLWLPVDVDPVLAQVPNPYDPNQINGHYYWDLCYYKGHYYLFYGATPCVLLFYPWLMLTGYDLNQCMACLIMCAVNLLLFGLILRLLSRNWFPACPLGWLAALFIAYGLANPMVFLLRLTDMYEIACESGATVLLLIAWALLNVFQTPTPRWRWLFLALVGFGWGAALGSRPNFLFAAALLPCVWLYLIKEQQSPRAVPRSRFIGETIALALPALIIAGLIGWYNEARFDSAMQFGLRYVTSGVNLYCMSQNSIVYVPARLWEYTLMPFRIYTIFTLHPHHFQLYFPCIEPGTRELNFFDTDRIAWEHITGIFPSFPILLLSLLWPWAIRKIPDLRQRHLTRVYCLCLGVVILGPVLFLLTLFSITYRYLCDFVPVLFVLSAVCLMARRNAAPFARWQAIVLGLFLVWTAYVGFAYSLVGDTNWIWSYYHDKLNLPWPWENRDWDFF